MLKGVMTALKALYIVLLVHYHTYLRQVYPNANCFHPHILPSETPNAKRSSINRLLHFCDVKLDV
jgi:hypothetical protein